MKVLLIISCMFHFITKLLGDPSQKKMRTYEKDLIAIKKIEEEYRISIDSMEAVQAKTHEFRSRFSDIESDTAEWYDAMKRVLEETKHEAFALHRRACELMNNKIFTLTSGSEYTWSMIPYDVQLIGWLALHAGSIAEMRTGEGKTLVATIAAYLNALAGIPVHIVTVNDYLARRDAAEMGVLYNFLGLTVGVIMHGQDTETKQKAYKSDIVYATNNELGFDYLRDNMIARPERRTMGPLNFAIIDEVDSILVDEARTPLIISAPDSEPTAKYPRFAAIARGLEKDTHYKIDEKQKTATLTEGWIQKLEEILGVENIYVSQHYNDVHHIENALKAGVVYHKDIDYIVRNDEIMIIDEHTGRVLPGRRYSDWLHQAIEAKENVTIQQESRTLASITFQNYFRLYRKLSGMTGTAKTEEEEFFKIYHLEVLQIPTNRPVIRTDRGDLLFRNERGKFQYVIKLIKAMHEKWQPILVGTVSVAKSEYLSDLLTAEGIPHNVLNAKQDAREAEIIANAWQYGAVTIATNMAGRGTDIKIDDRVRSLSGTVELEWAAGIQKYPLGGLFVLGTEKHETRRIDNQLRGRSGRQWDPWLSQFMVSPDDDIMRIFWGNRLFSLLARFESHPESDPLIESTMLMRNINTIQKQVEGRNFDMRKHVLEYDDVLNHHRLAIYSRRRKIVDGADIHSDVVAMLRDQLTRIIENALGERKIYEWEEDIIDAVNTFAEKEGVRKDLYEGADTLEDLVERSLSVLLTEIEGIRSGNEEAFADFERRLTLATMDELWMNHIDAMAHLREEVAFEGYAQKQPIVVYKERSYDKFITLLQDIGHRVSKAILTARPKENNTEGAREETALSHYANTGIAGFATETPEWTWTPLWIPLSGSQPNTDGVRILHVDHASPPQALQPVGRNEPCPCGSGKKYKQCHGK